MPAKRSLSMLRFAGKPPHHSGPVSSNVSRHTSSTVPRRTNRFQQLVFLIQHQLGGGAAVTESKMLPDRRSGAPVEVDVVVEGQIGGVALVIGIEVTAGGRRATVEWVNEMLGKHQDLPIDKTVLVSRAGFTPRALAKSTAHGAEALSLTDATARDWATWLTDLAALRVGEFTLQPAQPTVTFAAPIDPSLGAQLTIDARIQKPGSSTTNSLREYVESMMHDSQCREKVAEKWLQRDKELRSEPLRFTLGWPCPEGTTIQIGEHAPVPIRHVSVQISTQVRDAPFKASASRFRDRTVVHGETSLDLGLGVQSPVLVSMVGKDGQLESGAVLISEPGTSTPRLVPMTLPRTKK